jgi:hypothetical protein
MHGTSLMFYPSRSGQRVTNRCNSLFKFAGIKLHHLAERRFFPAGSQRSRSTGGHEHGFANTDGLSKAS